MAGIPQQRVSLLNIDASSTFKNFDIGSSWFGMQGEGGGSENLQLFQNQQLGLDLADAT